MDGPAAIIKSSSSIAYLLAKTCRVVLLFPACLFAAAEVQFAPHGHSQHSQSQQDKRREERKQAPKPKRHGQAPLSLKKEVESVEPRARA